MVRVSHPTREAILQDIAQHEQRIAELRAILPSAFKTLFRFRCKPGNQKVWIYAATREEADRKLRDRMAPSYGNEWSLASPIADEYASPKEAVGETSGSLFHSLTRDDAEELY